MNLKFLPLGSVCQVDNNDLKLVVIGYKMNGYDYVAVDYPNGYENESSLRYFNHNQIKDLYSYGYKDEIGKNHFVSLNDGTPNAVNSELEDNGFTFDDMGIVVKDETAVEIPMVEEEVNPGFYFDENGVVVVDTTAPEILDTPMTNVQTSEEKNNFEFDENGVVVTDTTAPLIPSVNNFQFDENGVVVGEPQTLEEQPKYQFDESGVVVGEPQTPKEQPKYRFDENGVVVEDLTSTLEQPTTQLEEEVVEEKVVDTGSITLVDPFSIAEEEPTINFNEDGTVAVDEDTQSIFGEIEAPGTIDEPKEEMTFDEKIEEETSNFDIPEETVSSVPAEDEAMATFDTASEQPQEEQPVEEPKKEEKKKRGFFNFGR